MKPVLVLPVWADLLVARSIPDGEIPSPADQVECREVRLELDPTRAVDSVTRALHRWRESRLDVPRAIVVGVITYWSLCYAVGERQMPPRRIWTWWEYDLLIDETEGWFVRVLPQPRREKWERHLDSENAYKF